MGIGRRCTDDAIPSLSLCCSLLFIPCFLALFCHAADTLTQDQVIRDGQSLISAGQTFTLGFFSPDNSTSRYLGIWYTKIPTERVWVANRDKPISGGGVFTLKNDGNLRVFDGNGNCVWSTNVAHGAVSNISATASLQDSGNLLLSSSNDTDEAHWQSFDHPTDTYLPGMRVRVNAAMGENRAFTSWKTANDPSPGGYSMGVDPRGEPQVVIWEGSNGRRWRSGYWNGLVFTGVPNMTTFYSFGYRLSAKDGDGNMYFTYSPLRSSDLLRFRIGWDGKEEKLLWDEGQKKWSVLQSQPNDPCDLYNRCGSFASCGSSNLIDFPICSCIKGFKPRYMDQWNKRNWSGGCTRKTKLQCESNNSLNSVGKLGHGFAVMETVKLPDFADWMWTKERKECEDKCLKNCSCNAYAFDGEMQCLLWNGDLVDIQQFSNGGKTLYVRLPISEIGGESKMSNVIIAIMVAAAVFLSVSIWLLWRFKAKLKGWKNSSVPMCDVNSGETSTEFLGPDDHVVGDRMQGNRPELRVFNFNSVLLATDNFSEENKLGQGGFGPVYKGKLPGGQEIAVKRLSTTSGQGLVEFKNEIILISKLQHRNLVRLLGYSIQGDEKMLLYEYMPNKSLDFFLFDPTRQEPLDWRKRFAIIEGIARGLLYLHRDSRLKIIHRDLKASNILLDEEMNPKISDFGMARIFAGNQTEANTSRVVGTIGYMSPEYIMRGLFSIKSDIYSFGVLLLEIVSGRKNSSFLLSTNLNLVGYAWNLCNEGKVVELIDPSIKDSCSQNEVLRCISVGMMCVQASATDRPNMSSVVKMLESENATLTMPRQDPFSSMSSFKDLDRSIEGQDIVSSNDITISEMGGR